MTDEIIDRVLFEGIEDTGENADCIIVLGSIKASLYRVPIAVKAYNDMRASKILLSGGIVNGADKGHADDMRDKAIALGVKAEDIIIENKSQNTVENMLCSMLELQRAFWLNRIEKVLLVTTTYHMRRSLAIAKYLFPDHIRVIPCPADDNNTRRGNWMESEEGRKRATSEVIKIINCVNNGLFPDFEI
ncbi:YdcF family protein [Butyrivibrio fibrisolvens]|uniref:YdcF family protein n=1 Tax=Butyrivibrio fibrisolvens TaxID=831 RepID=UPI0030CFB169